MSDAHFSSTDDDKKGSQVVVLVAMDDGVLVNVEWIHGSSCQGCERCEGIRDGDEAMLLTIVPQDMSYRSI